MAKRRHGGGSELPFVALMDTLTNVVGVLTIVLVMVGISLAKAVRKVLSELPPVSIEQIQTAQAKLDQLNASRDATRSRLEALRRDPLTDAQKQAAVQAELATLEVTAKDKATTFIDLVTPRAELAKREAEFQARSEEVKVLSAERDRLKVLLDKTPVPKQATSKVVRMPDARDIPASADIYHAYVIGKQVHLVDPLSAKKLLMDSFHQQSARMIRQVIKVKHARDRVIYDQVKVVEHFAKLNLSVRGQKISVPYNKTSTRLGFHIEIDPKQGGVTIPDPLPPDSEWQHLCERLRALPRAVLMFHVRPDAYVTYLGARDVADALRIPCGWILDGGTGCDGALNEFEVNQLEQPPPPPPPTKPQGPPPLPGPKVRLD